MLYLTMREIKLTQGLVALVDDEDFEYLNQWKWCVQKNRQNRYAARFTTLFSDGIKKRVQLRMHQVLLKMYNQKSEGVDFIDNNGLNLTKINIRVASQTEAKRNGKKTIKVGGTKSQFKGVTFHKKTGKYHASIFCDKKAMSLKYHDTEVLAAIAYNEAAIKYHGEFANLNQV
jgi:hypothetical protein